MTLVEAVLELKNKLSQLPPEDYVVVVKVTGRVEYVREVGASGLTLKGKLPGWASTSLVGEEIFLLLVGSSDSQGDVCRG